MIRDYAFYVLSLILIAGYGVISVPKFKSGRWMALAVALLMFGSLAMTIDMLGRPRPVSMAGSATGTLIGWHIVENEALYIYVLEEGSNRPTSFVIPWKEGGEDTSEELSKHLVEIERGMEIMLRVDEGRVIFGGETPEAPPVKEPQQEEAVPHVIEE